ncbi:hypothetical protein [Patulibacter americanus]|uniref:hypothetical protein n=1 Tax=Patulibacter americanus TaxID=588672 RepID=UPI0012FCE3D1|nr:hypothetical protein [Patulibacter americanus]
MTDSISESEFSILAFREPAKALKRIGYAWQRSPEAASRAASLHLILGDFPEALALGRLALRRAGELDVQSRVRALIAVGTAGTQAHLDLRYRDAFIEARGLLRDHQKLGTDIEVVLLINWASSQMGAYHYSAAHSTLLRAAEVANQLPASWPLKSQRLNVIEFNRFMLSDWQAREPVTAYAEMASKYERGGAWNLAAQCQLIYAGQLRQAKLYTAAVHHASRAERAAVAADAPQLLFRARAEAARVFRNLGMADQAREILETPRPGLRGSAAAADAGRLEMERSSETDRTADYDASLTHLERAWHHFEPIVVTAPGIAVRDLPLSELLFNALLTARMVDDTSHFDRWALRTETTIGRFKAMPSGSPHALMLQTMLAFVAGDRSAAEANALALEDLAKELAVDSSRVVTLQDLDDLNTQLEALVTSTPSQGDDVAEYFGHLAHVAAEDDESVRAAFRRANIIPVLNRMLMRGELTPWGQFEAVELSRWGSLSGALGRWTDSPTAKSQLRERFLMDAAARKASYPASLGEPHTLRWTDRWPGGVAPDSRTLDKPGPDALESLDLGRMIGEADWCEVPEVLQLYRLGSDIVWSLIDCSDGSISSGRVRLDTGQQALLAATATWSSPAVAPLDHRLLTAARLSPEHLPTVAAVRCCTGPFVDNLIHAQDFALRLPAGSRNALANALRALERPRIDAIGRAISGILPRTVAVATDRPLLMAIAPDLATVPWGLGTDNTGRFLMTQRPVAMLPPANTIAATTGRRATSDVPAWDLIRIGSSFGNLSYAGASAPVSMDVLIGASRGTECRGSAVLYVGHLYAGTGVPSESSIPLAPSDRNVLTAADIMQMSGVASERAALMCCRGAGVHFSHEWGGFASALMLKGANEIIAPIWPLIDSLEAGIVDNCVASTIVRRGHLELHVRDLIRELSLDARIAPHWWAGMTLVKG